MRKLKIALLFLSLPLLLFSQTEEQGITFLKKSIAIYKEAPGLYFQVGVNLLSNNQILKEYSFNCTTLSKGANRRLEIRNTVLIEVDSLQLIVDHGIKTIELRRRNTESLSVEDLSQEWLVSMEVSLESFIRDSKMIEEEKYVKFSNNVDQKYAETIYVFNKENFLLEKIIYQMDPENNQIPYDQLVLAYQTKLLSNDEKIDYGLDEFIQQDATKTSLKTAFSAYEFNNLLKNQ